MVILSYNNLYMRDIQDTVLLMSVDNKFEPSDFWVPENNIIRVLTFIIYILIWFVFIFVLNTKYTFNNKVIAIGFVSGLIILILYDYLFNYSVSLGVDQNTSSFFIYNPISQNVVLNKKVLDFKHSNGYLITKNDFEKLKKNKEFSFAPIKKYLDNQYVKSLGGEFQATPLSVYDFTNDLLISGSYLFITLITGCIIASHHNKNLFNHMLPFAVMSGILSLGVISLWFTERNYADLVFTKKFKSKIYIYGFSFALSCISAPFFFD